MDDNGRVPMHFQQVKEGEATAFPILKHRVIIIKNDGSEQQINKQRRNKDDIIDNA